MALLLFNWCGYQLVINYLQDRADKELNIQLDNHQYNESELTELRIPLNMPYQNNSSEFERVYGEITYNGIIYSFVKRKIEDGYLVLKCIPNKQKESIQKEGHELAKSYNGIDQDQKSSTPSGKPVKSTITEYVQNNLSLSIHSINVESLLSSIIITSHVCAGYKNLLTQPPDFIIS